MPVRAHSRWGLIGTLVIAFVSAHALSRQGDLEADEPDGARPLATSGIPTADGWVFPHYGLTRPPEDGGPPWALRRVGTRMIGGRALDVYRYARADDAARGALSTVGGFPEADLVDPLTGERVGGLSGDGLDSPADPAPTPCATGR